MEGPFRLSRGVIDAVASDPRPAVFLLRRIDNLFWGWIRTTNP